GAPGGIEQDVTDPHGLTRTDGEARDLADVLHLVGRHVPHRVELAGEQRRDLRGLLRDEALHDLADCRLALGAALPLFRVLDEDDRLAGLEALDQGRAGAGRPLWRAPPGRP